MRHNPPNQLLILTVTYPEGQAISHQLELGQIECNQCHRAPQVGEIQIDRAGKTPSQIWTPEGAPIRRTTGSEH